MRILIADDRLMYRQVIEELLKMWGFADILVASDGNEAWEFLENEEIDIALLDWVMPGVEGVELCRRIREMESEHYIYCILLTAKESPHEIAEGLNSGADDYIKKPFHEEELLARLKVGIRYMEIDKNLKKNIKELQATIAENAQLRGLLPICANCKKIRDDSGYWQDVEKYIERLSGAQITHSICRDCAEKLYPELYHKK